MRLLLRGCVLALTLALAVRAHAQSGAAAPQPPAPEERAPRDSSAAQYEWYGWQTLSVDLASLTLIGAAAASGDAPVLAIVGLAGYALGAPAIQLAHDNDWAGPSLGLRLGSFALMLGGVAVALSGGCFVIWGEKPSGCATREAVGSVMAFAGLAVVPVAIVSDALKARTKRSPEPATPQLGLWGDPTKGTVGFSLAMAR